MSVILDICIASFNKGKTTAELVSRILECKNEALEVVVVDNCSTDDTISLLNKINDSRLIVIKNDKNIGGSHNFVKAVLSGNAPFSLYCNDRDLIFPEKLDCFISFLSSNMNLACGWVVRTVNNKIGNYALLDSYHFLNEYCFRSEHPTGFFYNKAFLKKIDNTLLDSFSDSSIFVPFPWECLEAECCSLGLRAVYNDVIWASTGDTTHNKYISSYVALEDIDDRWFSVSNTAERIKYYLSQLTRINLRINLNNDKCYQIKANAIFFGYKICVWRYKTICETPSLAYHYSIKMHNVEKKEIIALTHKYEALVFDTLSFEEKNGVYKIYKKRVKEYMHSLRKKAIVTKLKLLKKRIFK